MDQRVVAGFDGSTQSAAASRWAAAEALLHGVPLRLVHVAESYAVLDVPAAGSGPRPGYVDELLRGACEELRAEYPRLDIGSATLEGRPAEALAGAAADATMLVLGSRGLGTVAGVVLGSVGMAVVHASERPVVLVRAAKDTAPHGRARGGPPEPRNARGGHAEHRVVVGVDTGHPCEALLAFAFEEAARRHCPLVALHSWTLPPLAGYGAAYSPEGNARMADTARAGLDEVLRPWRERCPTVALDARSEAGRPAEQLLEAGAAADLVVVGRRVRRSRIGGHIGRVTHAVLHHSTAPVAVVAHT
ncbi:universal stress protein [Streptomyces sp. NPDC052042]|uniref:universal stress protein n=1 Tax=Streptomyces sp. NPDC052042 TaxID=3365683 RepID=UPI0037D2C967